MTYEGQTGKGEKLTGTPTPIQGLTLRIEDCYSLTQVKNGPNFRASAKPSGYPVSEYVHTGSQSYGTWVGWWIMCPVASLVELPSEHKRLECPVPLCQLQISSSRRQPHIIVTQPPFGCSS